MEFSLEKCAMLIMKSCKRHLTDGMEKKETYKYLSIKEADTIKQVETKEKIMNEYLRTSRKLRDKTIYQKPYLRFKYLGSDLCLIFRTLFEEDQRRT